MVADEGAPGRRCAVGHGTLQKNDKVFEKDPVTKLSGIGEEKARELKRVGSVKEVGHVARLSDKKIKTLAKSNGLSVGFLEKARDEAKTAKPGKFKSKRIDHKKKPNPYKSLYGDDWMKVIDASTNMKKWINIRQLVLHMAKESDRLMEGTQFEGKAMFKHDALSLMTAKGTREWMEKTLVNGRSIYSRWLLPEAGLNKRIDLGGGRFTRRYANRPPGNLPRLMILDKYGNNALVVATDDHVSVAWDLPYGPDISTDPKFELCDSVCASRAYLRC